MNVRASLLVAFVAVLGCRTRQGTTISVDPATSAAPDAVAARPTVSFTQATFEENHGVHVTLSWPILVLPKNRGAAMSATIEHALRADAQEVVDEYGNDVKSAGPAGGAWLDHRFVHVVCAPTLVAPALVSVACRHAWNRGDAIDDGDWITTYAWTTAKGSTPLAIDDVVGAGRQPLATLVWTAMEAKRATSGATVDDVARNDLGAFFFDRSGVTFVPRPYGDWKGDLTLHLDWVQLRSAAHDASIVDGLEKAAQDPRAITNPFVAPFG